MMAGLIYLIILIAIIVIEWFAAKEFAKIAADKGYTDKKYFWWCFLWPIVGFLMVIAMPNRNTDNSVVNLDELPGL